MKYKVGQKVVVKAGFSMGQSYGCELSKGGETFTVSRLDDGILDRVRNEDGESFPVGANECKLFEPYTPAPKFGDKIWLTERDGEEAYYLGEMNGLIYFSYGGGYDMALQKIHCDFSVSFTEPKKEDVIDLTVNGKSVTISPDTLKAIKEAL